MTYQSDHTRPLPAMPWWRRKQAIILGAIGGVLVLCCGGAVAIGAISDSRRPPAPVTVDASGSASSGAPPGAPSGAPPGVPSSDAAAPTSSPTPAPPPPVQPTDAVPPPPPPADDAGTPTISGIRAGEFCKKVLAGSYAYDSHGSLLYCGPPGAAHPRWSHA